MHMSRLNSSESFTKALSIQSPGALLKPLPKMIEANRNKPRAPPIHFHIPGMDRSPYFIRSVLIYYILHLDP